MKGAFLHISMYKPGSVLPRAALVIRLGQSLLTDSSATYPPARMSHP